MLASHFDQGHLLVLSVTRKLCSICLTGLLFGLSARHMSISLVQFLLSWYFVGFCFVLHLFVFILLFVVFFLESLFRSRFLLLMEALLSCPLEVFFSPISCLYWVFCGSLHPTCKSPRAWMCLLLTQFD